MGKFFKTDADRNPQQKAQFATSRAVIRLLCAGYVIYLGIRMITQAYGEMSADGFLSPLAAIIVGAVMLAVALFLLILTARDAVRAFKNGEFDKMYYYRQQYGEDFTEQDAAALETREDEEKALAKRRNNEKDSFSEREELDRLLAEAKAAKAEPEPEEDDASPNDPEDEI